MLNEKAVFSLITRKEYDAVNYLLTMMDKVDCRYIKDTSCRTNDISEARKIVIKAVKDRYPDIKNSIISKQMGITVQGIREAFVQANIFYSTDSEFARKYDNYTQ